MVVRWIYIYFWRAVGADCEGAGDMFRVTATRPSADMSSGTADVENSQKNEFFNQPTFLTVSGQVRLHLMICCEHGVSTFSTHAVVVLHVRWVCVTVLMCSCRLRLTLVRLVTSTLSGLLLEPRIGISLDCCHLPVIYTALHACHYICLYCNHRYGHVVIVTSNFLTATPLVTLLSSKWWSPN